MWQRYLLTTIACLFAIILSSALLYAADVQTDYDTQKDFSQFHYYDWLPQTDSIDSELTTLNVDNAKEILALSLDRQMTPASEKFAADFLVRYYIKSVKKLVDDRPRVGIGMGGFNDNMGGGVSFSLPFGGNDLDQNAQIVVDFLDPKTQRLLWRGSETIGISSSSTQINQKQLQKAFDEILKQFPPRH
ncbi:MAG TPA: DUF4136 domain-containing protein [Spongiibacteraceae bacterium]|jgi:hypothetical protein